MSDGELARLRHDFEADPGDENAARRYTNALFRVGKRAEATELFRFKFLCEKTWSELAPREGGVRFCAGCEKNVYVASTEEELRHRVRLGHCVAIPASRVAPAFEQIAQDPKLSAARSASDPCVVGEKLLAPAAPSEALRAAVPSWLARSQRVVPLRIEDGKVYLAHAGGPLSFPPRHRAWNGLEPVFVLATEDEVRAGLDRLYGAEEPEGHLMGAIRMPSEAERRHEQGRREVGALIEREDFRGAEALATRLLAEARGSAELAHSRNELFFLRAKARGRRRDHEGALTDLGELDSGRQLGEGVLLLRAQSRMCSGHFAEAVADWTLLIDRRAPNGHYLEGRARARALAQDREGARADLLAGMELLPTDGYAALWLAALLGDRSKLEAYDDRPGWFGRLVAFGLGRLEAAKLIAEAGADADQRVRRERSCEAHGYVALDLDRRGESAAARRHYEACLAANVTHFIEDEWAQARLARASARA